jgi:hypothetical protein
LNGHRWKDDSEDMTMNGVLTTTRWTNPASPGSEVRAARLCEQARDGPGSPDVTFEAVLARYFLSLAVDQGSRLALGLYVYWDPILWFGLNLGL